MLRKVILYMCIAGLSLGYALSEEEGDKILQLKLGHPEFADKTMSVSPGQIYSAKSGTSLSFEKMLQQMSSARVVYVGESHNSLPMHQIQARIIRALFAQGQDLSIGLEMFTEERQAFLNQWSLGLLTEDEFIRAAEWYVAWNFNYNYYSDIFNASRDLNIPIYALNAPRTLISKIRMRGWDALTEEEKAQVPEPDLSHDGHRQLIRAVFADMDMPHQMKGAGLEKVFESLYRAQSAWDEVMAHNVVQALDWNERRMVVLAGAGHCWYNLGINRRVYEKKNWAYSTVICVTVPKGESSVTVSRGLADFVWALAEEDKPVYPSVGLKFKKFEHLENLVLDQKPIDGMALDAGFEKGDVILTVDDRNFYGINDLRIYLSKFTWGDQVKIKLLRNGQEKEIELEFKVPQEEKDETKENREVRQ
jgi:uncharacterized iron-regulated protein